MKNIHWLLKGAWPGKDAVLRSGLASIRLRAGPSAAHLPVATAMTFGDDLPRPARLLLVGKYLANDPSRHQRWMDAIKSTRAGGGRIWIDYTDNHLGAETHESPFYREAMQAADGAILPSPGLQAELQKHWNGPTEIIEDASDFAILPPKGTASSPRVLMWFGGSINLPYLVGVLGMFPKLIPIRLIIVTSNPGFGWFSRHAVNVPANVQVQFCPWSIENMIYTAGLADACLIPSDPADPRKNGASSNRLISALSLGLPVAADMLDSYREFADCFVDLRSGGFQDMVADPLGYRDMVLRAQDGIVQRFSAEVIGRTWARFIDRSLGAIA
jgi:hypothetical protein